MVNVIGSSTRCFFFTGSEELNYSSLFGTTIGVRQGWLSIERSIEEELSKGGKICMEGQSKQVNRKK